MVRNRQVQRLAGVPLEYAYLSAIPAEEETKDENSTNLSIVDPNYFPASFSDFVIPLNGKSAIGGTTWNPTSKVAYAIRRIYISATTNIVAIWLYYSLAGAGGTRQVYVGIYSDNAGSPDALLGTGNLGIINTTAIWGRISVGTIAVAAGYYWIVVLWNPGLYDGTFTLYYDAETSACAQDGTVATLPNPFGMPVAWLNYGITSLIETTGPGQKYLQETFYQGQSFLATAGRCRGMQIKVKRVGVPPGSLIVELKSTSFTGTVLASGALIPTDIDTDFKNLLVTFSSPYTLVSGTTYYLTLRQANDQGDDSNRYVLAASSDGVGGTAAWAWGSTWTNVPDKDLNFGVPIYVEEEMVTQATTSATYYSVYGTTNWLMQSFKCTRKAPYRRVSFWMLKVGTPPEALTIALREVDPTSGKPKTTDLATGTIAAASVGTSAAWKDITFSWPMEKDKYYTIVARSPGSNSSNYYQLSYVTTNPYADGQVGTSADSGATWTLVPANDLAFKIWVPKEQLIFDQNFSPSGLEWEVAKVQLGLWLKVKSLDGQYMTVRALVDGVEATDVGLAYDGIESSEIETFDRTKSVPQTTWNLKLYGAGDGVVERIRYARHHYCDSQTITPQNFDVAELSLASAVLSPGSLVILNDRFKQRLYADDSGERIFDATGLAYRIRVQKAYFAKGQADLLFIGR